MYTLYMTLIAVSCLPLGYISVTYLGRRLRSYAFGVLLPLYLVFGLTFFSLAALVVVSVGLPLKISVYLILSLSLMFVFLSEISRKTPSPHKSGFLGSVKFPIIRESVISIFLLSISILYFGYIADKMRWAPPGDSAALGTRTSIMLYADGVPLTYYPISNSSFILWQYPPIFPVISAVGSIITQVYPGQAMLTIGALVSALIPSVLYAIVFMKTRSISHSMMSYFLAFMIPLGDLFAFRNILFSNFLNGTYPNHIANLLLITFFGIVIIKFGHQENTTIINPLMMTLALTAVLAYYPYASFIIGYYIGAFIVEASQVKVIGRHIWTTILGLASISVVILFVLRTTTFSFWVRLIEDFKLRAIQGASYRIDVSTISWEYSLVIFFSLLLTLVFLTKRDSIASIGFAVNMLFFLPTILSLNDYAFNYLWFFPTKRTWSLLYSLSVAIFCISLYYTKNKFQFRLKVKFRRYILANYNILTVAFFIILVSIGLYEGIFFYNFSPGTWQRPVDEDFEALEWIVKNTSPTDLVLNDRSFSGLFLTSFRTQSVVNEYVLVSETFGRGPMLPDYLFINRSLRANMVFDNPENYDSVRLILKEYGIKYVYVSSHNLFADYWHPVEIGSLYQYEWRSRLRKHESTEMYIYLFDKNPYLEAVFIKGNARVYKVRTEVLDVDGAEYNIK